MQPNISAKVTKIGIPSSEGTGLICRIPLTRFLLQALAFSARAPVLVLGTIN